MTLGATVRCTVEGCTRTDYYAKGMCRSHYDKVDYRSETRKCKEPGCERVRFVRGWCAMHYHRMERYGTMEEPVGRLPEEDVSHRTCTACAKVLPVTEFRKHKSGRWASRGNTAAYNPKCRACDNAVRKQRRLDNPEREKYRHVTQFGITKDDFLEMMKKQEDRCAICRIHVSEYKTRKRFSVDHDHVTGKVRGLLCGLCNTMLGQAQDNPEVLRAAITYLGKDLVDSCT